MLQVIVQKAYCMSAAVQIDGGIYLTRIPTYQNRDSHSITAASLLFIDAFPT